MASMHVAVSSRSCAGDLPLRRRSSKKSIRRCAARQARLEQLPHPGGDGVPGEERIRVGLGRPDRQRDVLDVGPAVRGQDVVVGHAAVAHGQEHGRFLGMCFPARSLAPSLSSFVREDPSVPGQP